MWHSLYTPPFVREGLFFFQLCLLISFYLAINCTFTHRVALPFVHDHEFLLGTGSSHQMQLSRQQNKSELHIKIGCAFVEMHCENQAVGRGRNKRSRPEAL